MDCMQAVTFIFPPITDEEGRTINEELIVSGYVNLDEVLDYFETNRYEERITAVVYINGLVRYVRMELGKFNGLMLRYKSFISKNNITSKFN